MGRRLQRLRRSRIINDNLGSELTRQACRPAATGPEAEHSDGLSGKCHESEREKETRKKVAAGVSAI